MSNRAAAAARTRRRIVEATLELHGEKGIAATRWDEIADRAGVGVGTVYRHFPSLDALIPACGDVAMEALALPDPATVPALFEHATDPAGRIARLVREVFAIYERAAPALRAIRRESDVHPRVAQDRKAIESALGALVAEALGALEISDQDRAITRALLDLGTWDALRGTGARAGRIRGCRRRPARAAAGPARLNGRRALLSPSAAGRPRRATHRSRCPAAR